MDTKAQDAEAAVADLSAVVGAALRGQACVHDRTGGDGTELLVGGVVSVRQLAEAVLAAGYLKVDRGTQ